MGFISNNTNNWQSIKIPLATTLPVDMQAIILPKKHLANTNLCAPTALQQQANQEK